MISVWATFFLTGALMGKALAIPRPAVPGVIPLTMVILFAWIHQLRARPSARLSLGVIALWWGLSHNAPPPPRALTDVVTVSPSAGTPKGRVMILSSLGTFESLGTAPPGTRGSVSCGPPSLWGPCLGIFRARTGGGGSRPLGPTESLIASTRLNVRQHLSVIDRDRRWWIEALVLGDKTNVPPSITNIGKRAGLYHLLVVSGSHVTMLAGLLFLTLRWPFQAAYAWRVIRAPMWMFVDTLLRLLVPAVVLLYGAMIDFAPPVQRACVLFALWTIVPLILRDADARGRLVVTMAAQSVLFPAGFLSESNILSWAAFLCVAIPLSDRHHGVLNRLRVLLGTQLLLAIVTAGIIGQLSIAGLFLNPIVIPLFSLVVYPAVAAAILCRGLPEALVNWLLRPAELFGEALVGTTPLFERWWWLAIPINSAAARALAVTSSIAALLWLCRRLHYGSIVAEWMDEHSSETPQKRVTA